MVAASVAAPRRPADSKPNAAELTDQLLALADKLQLSEGADGAHQADTAGFDEDGQLLPLQAGKHALARGCGIELLCE